MSTVTTPLSDDLCDGTWKNTKLVTQASFKKLSAGDYEWQVRAVVSAGSTPEYEYANGEVWWEFTVLSKSSRITLFKVSPLNGAVDLATSVTTHLEGHQDRGRLRVLLLPDR